MKRVLGIRSEQTCWVNQGYLLEVGIHPSEPFGGEARPTFSRALMPCIGNKLPRRWRSLWLAPR